MKTHAYLSAVAALLLILGFAAPLQAEPKAKNKDLIDFTVQDIERSGAEVKVTQKYGYAYGDWQDKVTYIDKRGLLVNYAGGQGGMGGDKTMKLGDFDFAYLLIVIGNRNEGNTLGITLIDEDGTEATWYFPLAGKPRGAVLVCKMALVKPDKEEKPGSVPGLNKTKIRKWQIKGDWQSAKFEVLLVKLGATS